MTQDTYVESWICSQKDQSFLNKPPLTEALKLYSIAWHKIFQWNLQDC